MNTAVFDLFIGVDDIQFFADKEGNTRRILPLHLNGFYMMIVNTICLKLVLIDLPIEKPKLQERLISRFCLGLNLMNITPA